MVADPVVLSPQDTVAAGDCQDGRAAAIAGCRWWTRPAGRWAWCRVKQILHYLVQHFPGRRVHLPPAPDHRDQRTRRGLTIAERLPGSSLAQLVQCL